MTDQHSILFGDYTVRSMEDQEFGPLIRQYRPVVFDRSLSFNVQEALSAEETEAVALLRARTGTPYRLILGIFHREEFVGWSFGRQDGHERYNMVNTGILPEHQNKGIYTALLPRILEMVRKEGFQIAYSRHAATNNQVLIPKLKAGFIISGVELSDLFGTLVHLSYFFNPLRRKVMDVRSGQSVPDQEVRRYMRFE
jgi:GNAT superfamily N-acetyltransferase